MKNSKRSTVVWIVVTFVFILGLGGALFYYLQNKADASVGYDGTTCPQLSAPAPGWCSDGTIVASSPTSNGCAMPPNCLRSITPTPTITSTTACGTSNGIAVPCASPPNSPTATSTVAANQVTYNLATGFNLIVVPEYMYQHTNPIYSTAFSGMTIYNYTNGNWQLDSRELKQGASYLVKNREGTKSVTINGTGEQLTGSLLNQSLTKGWNMVANNYDVGKRLDELVFSTYVVDPNCQTVPFCEELKSLAQLYSENRIYSRIYFFNDLTSSDANTFYATKILSSADLANYRIPARSGFWLYLYQ